jgi:hypothetical protein
MRDFSAGAGPAAASIRQSIASSRVIPRPERTTSRSSHRNSHQIRPQHGMGHAARDMVPLGSTSSARAAASNLRSRARREGRKREQTIFHSRSHRWSDVVDVSCVGSNRACSRANGSPVFT